MSLVRVAAVVLVVSGCAARPDLASHAPAGTRLLARLDAGPLLTPAVFTEQLVPLAKACGFDPFRDVTRVEVAIGDAGMIAEVDGNIDTKKVDCVNAGRWSFGVSDRQHGGVRIAWPATLADGPGAPADLAAAYRAMDRPGVALAADLVGGEVPMRVVLGLSGASDVAARVRLSPADRETVRALLAKALPDLTINVAGDDLVINGHVNLSAAMAIRTRMLELFKVPSASMAPTLLVGDHVIAVKGRLARVVHRGDVVVYRTEHHPLTAFMKRLIGIPGQRIRWAGRDLFIDDEPVTAVAAGPITVEDVDEDGQRFSDRHLLSFTETLAGQSHLIAHSEDPNRAEAETTLAPGEYFLLGDNRDDSNDSRFAGAVKGSELVGRVALIWFSLGPDGPRWERIGKLVR